MTVKNSCPTCNSELQWDAGSYQCTECNITYSKLAFCPSCEAELEKLQACGSVSYFCNTCNEMKSKSAVRIEFHQQN
ncbi:zinc ribbon domain-containing protein [Vibrio sp. MA40-2]|uniref:zinc ribbon domain-containing protein n=1 Tax=Vibrio sp. MA40-2 TaxID=3391828 RepID=UPI0039A6D501